VSVLESVFLTLGLCATVENDMTGRIEYEFSSLNFLSENEALFSKFANNKSFFSSNSVHKLLVALEARGKIASPFCVLLRVKAAASTSPK
jgi:hypothetical protein